MSEGDAGGLWISRTKRIPEQELEIQRVRSGGPGGQNVNKTASKVVLRFRPATSTAFTPDERELIERALSHRLNQAGELVIHSNEHRSAGSNLEAARERLAAWLRAALTRPKLRRPTRPSRGSVARRLLDKRRRSDRKRERSGGSGE